MSIEEIRAQTIIDRLMMKECETRKSYSQNPKLQTQEMCKELWRLREVLGVVEYIKGWDVAPPTVNEMAGAWPHIHRLTGMHKPDSFVSLTNYAIERGARFGDGTFEELQSTSRELNLTRMAFYMLFILWDAARRERVQANKVARATRVSETQKKINKLHTRVAKLHSLIDSHNIEIAAIQQQITKLHESDWSDSAEEWT